MKEGNVALLSFVVYIIIQISTYKHIIFIFNKSKLKSMSVDRRKLMAASNASVTGGGLIHLEIYFSDSVYFFSKFRWNGEDISWDTLCSNIESIRDLNSPLYITFFTGLMLGLSDENYFSSIQNTYMGNLSHNLNDQYLDVIIPYIYSTDKLDMILRINILPNQGPIGYLYYMEMGRNNSLKQRQFDLS